MGLGTVWLGIYPNDDRVEGMRRLTHVPEQVIPMALIVVGYPAERPTTPDRYDPGRVHSNTW
jgi:nitroreductase